MGNNTAEARKTPVFVSFRRAGIEALRKKLLEYFTIRFAILNDIIV